VEITPAQYADFTVNTIIDCKRLTGQLRAGVLQSPTVERRIKAIIRE